MVKPPLQIGRISRICALALAGILLSVARGEDEGDQTLKIWTERRLLDREGRNSHTQFRYFTIGEAEFLKLPDIPLHEIPLNFRKAADLAERLATSKNPDATVEILSVELTGVPKQLLENPLARLKLELLRVWQVRYRLKQYQSYHVVIVFPNGTLVRTEEVVLPGDRVIVE